MHKLSRSLFAGLVAMGTLVACDDVETNPILARVTSVNVVPQQLQLSVGGTATLTATVVGDAGLEDRGVTWASSNTAVATVDAAGNVRGVAPGQTTIIASSHADPNVKGAAAVVVTAAALPAVSINSITKNGLPVDITNVQGQVDVTLNVAGNGAPVYGVALLVQCPNNTAPVEVQRQTFSNGQAPNGPITLSFNSAAINAAGTGPQFTNGACNVITRLLNAQGTAIAEVGDVVRPLTFQNVDYVAATLVGKSSVDNLGQTWWGGGDIQVRVTPVLFSGQTSASGIVTLTGTDNATGAAISRQATWTGAGTQTVTFPNVSTGTNPAGVAGLTLPDANVTAVVLTSAGAAVPVVTQAAAFRLDEQAPVSGTFPLTGSQGNEDNWVGTAFTFAATTAAGYTAGTSVAGTTAAPNDFGGVDRVTVQFQYAPRTSSQACPVGGTASSALVFTTVTAGSAIPSSPNLTNQEYCLRMLETDALGNVRTTVLGIFGVDLAKPIITSVTPANQTEITNTSDITVTMQDSISGFGNNPLNATVLRQTATASTCAVGVANSAGTACAAAAQVGGAGSAGSTTLTVVLPATTATEAYYSFSGQARDQAGNLSDAVSRVYIIDNTAPTAVAVVQSTPTVPAGSAPNFNGHAEDNLDLNLARSWTTYLGGTISIQNQDVTLGEFGPAAFTRSADFSITPVRFYRSMTTSAASAGTAPTLFTVQATDFGGNATTASATIVGVTAASTFSTLGTFGTTANPASVCNPTSSATACGTSAQSTTLTTTATTASAQANPFARIDYYYVDPSTGRLVFISSATSAAVVDNGATRTFTWTLAYNPIDSLSGSVTVYAIGVNASGDAFLGTATAVTITNP